MSRLFDRWSSITTKHIVLRNSVYTCCSLSTKSDLILFMYIRKSFVYIHIFIYNYLLKSRCPIAFPSSAKVWKHLPAHPGDKAEVIIQALQFMAIDGGERTEETNIGILRCLGSRVKKLERGFNTEKLKGCSPFFSSMDKRGQNSKTYSCSANLHWNVAWRLLRDVNVAFKAWR